MITIFTPVYNRADIIEKLYNSIKQQSFKDFEWLVVNDGSSDNINEVMRSFIAEGVINIRYFSQPNGGKHRAINKGVELAKGDLFFIADSDDTLTPDALHWLNYYYQQVKDNEIFAGVSGYRCLPNGSGVYERPEENVIDCSSIEYAYRYNSKGGNAEAFKTEIMKEYPFPDIEGERFCAESLVWNRIARKYKLRYFNKFIYVWNYLPMGLTSGSIRNRIKSPTYAMINYSEMLDSCVPLRQKIRNAINFWRFYFIRKHKTDFKISLRWYPFAILGYLCFCRDKKILEKF